MSLQLVLNNQDGLWDRAIFHGSQDGYDPQDGSSSCLAVKSTIRPSRVKSPAFVARRAAAWASALRLPGHRSPETIQGMAQRKQHRDFHRDFPG